MKREIVINAGINETCIAITENNELLDFFFEIPEKERLVGNIYLGKVQKIVQNMNAAFVDIGLPQDAFLHFSDLDSTFDSSVASEEDDEDEDYDSYDSDASGDAIPEGISDAVAVALRMKKASPRTSRGNRASPTFTTKRSGTIAINLQPKQTIIVQAVREAYSTKGVRVSTKVSIPGRYMVLVPFEQGLGVSRKISSVRERRRLRTITKSFLPSKAGCIIRTAARDKSEADLRKDWDHLFMVWQEIENAVQRAKEPGVIYKDKNLAGSIIRDLFTSDISGVVVDSRKMYREIRGYLEWTSPELVERLELYEGPKPVFEAFRIERQIAETSARKVPLPSGGSIVLDQTEALFVVDVNSGRSTSEQEQERMALKTNLEAARAVAKQLRLRDVGGIIIIDFIDMMLEENRRKVFNEMKRELNYDKAKTVIYPVTQLGLMQMTRQRVRQVLTENMSDLCNNCGGTGRVPSKALTVTKIDRWLSGFRVGAREFNLMLLVHPTMADYLSEGTVTRLTKLMFRHFVRIKLRRSESLKPGEFRFFSLKTLKDLTSEAS